MISIIDSHCHLQSPHFDYIINDVMIEAENSGVKFIINAATEPSDWGKCRTISKKYDNVKLSLGIHPWYIPENYKQFFKSLSEVSFNDCTAIGEIGLDKKYSKHSIEKQIEIFSFFINIANDLNLPSVIHCISAFDELIAVIKTIGEHPPVIIHAFNGSIELAKQLMKYNIFFSMGGVLTYSENKKRLDLVNQIYPEKLLLETDSPDFTPRGIKSDFNKPSFITENLKALSKSLNKDVNEVGYNIFHLSSQIFKL